MPLPTLRFSWGRLQSSPRRRAGCTPSNCEKPVGDCFGLDECSAQEEQVCCQRCGKLTTSSGIGLSTSSRGWGPDPRPEGNRSNGVRASMVLRNPGVAARWQTVQAVPQKVTSGNLTLASSSDLPRPSSCQ
jgi:hypothetical protein